MSTAVSVQSLVQRRTNALASVFRSDNSRGYWHVDAHDARITLSIIMRGCMRVSINDRGEMGISAGSCFQEDLALLSTIVEVVRRADTEDTP